MELKLLPFWRRKFQSKMGQTKKDLTFLRVVLCSQPTILYSKYQFLSDLSRIHPSLILPR